MPDDPPSNGPNVRIGFLVAGSEMVSFTLAGLFLDYVFGTLPVFTIVLTLLGVAAAFYLLVKMSKSLAVKKPPKPPATSDGGTP